MQFATHNDSLKLGSLTQHAFGAKKPKQIHLELEIWKKLWEQQENKARDLLCSTKIMHLIC